MQYILVIHKVLNSDEKPYLFFNMCLKFPFQKRHLCQHLGQFKSFSMCVLSNDSSSPSSTSSEVSPSAPIISRPTTTNSQMAGPPPAPPPRRPVVPYQNVTRNNESNEFVLEDHFESLAIPNQQEQQQQQQQHHQKSNR